MVVRRLRKRLILQGVLRGIGRTFLWSLYYGFTIDLDYDMVDKIVYKQLLDTQQNFMKDLADYEAGEERNIFFWEDKESDIAEIQRYIEALDLLIDWYKVVK